MGIHLNVVPKEHFLPRQVPVLVHRLVVDEQEGIVAVLQAKNLRMSQMKEICFVGIFHEQEK
jgi:hypothetical protein